MEKDHSNAGAIREEGEARRGHRFLTVFLILLMAGLIAAGWYAYPILLRHDAKLSQAESQIPTIQKYAMSLDQQTKAMQAKIDDWSGRQDALRGQLAKARADLMARIDSAKKQASEASAALGERVRGEVATQVNSIKTELAKLETSGASEREQLARLQQELAQVRSQVTQQGQELASVQVRVTQNAASSEQEFAAVKSTQQQDRHDFDAYADKFAVKRVDFEVVKDHSSQVAPGISLQVNGTDVSYQRLSGSILVAPDQRTIWLRQLKVQEPVFLSSFEDGRTRELVITRVSNTGAVGYVLIPAQETAADRVLTSHVTNPARVE